jgi:hypothetical protein
MDARKLKTMFTGCDITKFPGNENTEYRYRRPYVYRMSQETSATFRVVIRWLISTEKCHINMVRNLNRNIVI